MCCSLQWEVKISNVQRFFILEKKKKKYGCLNILSNKFSTTFLIPQADANKLLHTPNHSGAKSCQKVWVPTFTVRHEQMLISLAWAKGRSYKLIRSGSKPPLLWEVTERRRSRRTQLLPPSNISYKFKSFVVVFCIYLIQCFSNWGQTIWGPCPIDQGTVKLSCLIKNARAAQPLSLLEDLSVSQWDLRQEHGGGNILNSAVHLRKSEALQARLFGNFAGRVTLPYRSEARWLLMLSWTQRN